MEQSEQQAVQQSSLPLSPSVFFFSLCFSLFFHSCCTHDYDGYQVIALDYMHQIDFNDEKLDHADS
jgi:hypothetical protein